MITRQEVQIDGCNVRMCTTGEAQFMETDLTITIRGWKPGNVLQDVDTVDLLEDVVAAAQGHNRRDDIDPLSTVPPFYAASALIEQLITCNADTLAASVDLLADMAKDHAVGADKRHLIKQLLPVMRKQLKQFADYA